MKRILITVIVTALFLTSCGVQRADTGAPASAPGSAAASDTGKYPAYLNIGNTDNYWQVVKEGMEGGISVKMAVLHTPELDNWENTWLSKFYKTFMNIDFEVEPIMSSNLGERKSLMFAADDLPDILFNLDLSSAELYRYGQMEGQLLDLSLYIDDELTPNMLKHMNERPEAKAIAITPDGNMYSLPRILDKVNVGARVFVDTRWLDVCGIGKPETVDEFITMLRLFKENDPTGVGRDQILPIGGADKWNNPLYIIANAFGYVGFDCYGNDRSIRNGDSELMAANPEIYKDFITICHTLYSEGLISENWYEALSLAEAFAQVSDKRAGVFATGVNRVDGYEEWMYWEALGPLTSKWNDKKLWPAPYASVVGFFCMSTKTEYAELGMRFADFFFPADSVMMSNGAHFGDDHEMQLGFPSILFIDPADGAVKEDISKLPGDYASFGSYVNAKIGTFVRFGINTMQSVIDEYYGKWYEGYKPPQIGVFDVTTSAGFINDTLWRTYLPYTSDPYPLYYYMDEETSLRASDLRAVIDPYVEEQLAMFAVGRRPLAEMDAFMDELNTLGIHELDAIYKGVYAVYLNALK